MSRAIRIAAAVNHERLEDEVIAINLETGAYFAFDDAAAECWSVAAAGGGAHEMAAVLVALYEVDAEVAAADAVAFAEGLVDARLAAFVDDPVAVVEVPSVEVRRPYVPPAVEGYDDLETLLLIDPIHDVDEAGWPAPPAQAGDV
ncbi:MAG: hypothetical protein RI958_2066 [Actinomycetota bacterium]